MNSCIPTTSLSRSFDGVPGRRRGEYRTRRIAVATVLLALCGGLVSTATAKPVRGWTPAQAAAKLKATYTAPDPAAVKNVQANIDQEKAGCGCDTNARIVSLLASLESAKHLAKPDRVTCKGSGRAVSGRYSRFHCSVHVVSPARLPPDYVPYTATVKVTVRVPYRVLAGWR